MSHLSLKLAAEIAPLDLKKKLIALKKKWGQNKADAYTRLVWMRAGDSYVRTFHRLDHGLVYVIELPWRRFGCVGGGKQRVFNAALSVLLSFGKLEQGRIGPLASLLIRSFCCLSPSFSP